MQIQYIGEFYRQGILNVHEIENVGNPATIYMSLKCDDIDLPDTPLGKVNLQSNEEFSSSLPTPVMQIGGTFRINKYRVFANNPIADNTVISAHYGLIRAGGIQFAVTDLVASSNDNFTYECDFYVIDMQYAFSAFALLRNTYNLVEQLSFDIASYTDGRRTAISTEHTTSCYPKLLVSLELTGNDLLIRSVDTNGVGAAQHIAMSLGIAEENISVTAKVTLKGIDKYGTIQSSYSIIAANPDFSDEPMHVIMPKQESKVIAAEIDVDYMLQLQTIGETVTLHNKLALTDEQVASLHPLTAIDIANGSAIMFALLNANNEPLTGVEITIGKQTVVTDDDGLATITVKPGTYIAYIAYQGTSKHMPIVVSGPAIYTVMLDIITMNMDVYVLGTDDYALSNLELTVGNHTQVTDTNGHLTVQGIQGTMFRLSKQLGETLHEYKLKMNDQKKVVHLYNAFDDEAIFTTEFT